MLEEPSECDDRLVVTPLVPLCLLRVLGLVLVLFSAMLLVWRSGNGLDQSEALCAAFFGLAGVGALVYREGVTLDRARGEVRKWWGFVVPLVARSFPLGCFDAVTVSFRGRSRRVTWSRADLSADVALTGRGRRLELRRFLIVDDARDFGRQVAAFSGLELVDLLR